MAKNNFPAEVIFNGVQKIAPDENYPRLGLGFGLGLGLGAIFFGGNCPRTLFNVSAKLTY